MQYLRNCWYVAAWADECTSDAPLARTLLDLPVVMFRNADGTASALLDRCPHRFAPLSSGTISEGALVCPYHGLGFAGTGKCVLNPHGPITSSMSAQAFPLVESYRALWIWMGEPAQADPALIPDLSFVDETPDTAFSKGYLAGHGNYQLYVDNILDLTHADFLHADTLGGGSFTRTRAKVFETEKTIQVQWHCFNEVPMPLSAKMKGSDAKVDSWTEVEWHVPAVMTLHSGSVPAGTPRQAGGSTTNLHIMTPLDAHNTHYFFASTRDFAVDDAALNAMFAQARDRIFATEDKPMIAAQQRRMGDAGFWDLNPILLRIDEGGVRVRRRLQGLIEREAAEQRTAETARLDAVSVP